MPTRVEPGCPSPVELHETLKRMAAKNGRPLNVEVLNAYVIAFPHYEQCRDDYVRQIALGGATAGPMPTRHVAGGEPALDAPQTSYTRARVPNPWASRLESISGRYGTAPSGPAYYPR
jgi:hypothetical protein